MRELNRAAKGNGIQALASIALNAVDPRTTSSGRSTTCRISADPLLNLLGEHPGGDPPHLLRADRRVRRRRHGLVPAAHILRARAWAVATSSSLIAAVSPTMWRSP